jgi:hypothetical protein
MKVILDSIPEGVTIDANTLTFDGAKAVVVRDWMRTQLDQLVRLTAPVEALPLTPKLRTGVSTSNKRVVSRNARKNMSKGQKRRWAKQRRLGL